LLGGGGSFSAGGPGKGMYTRLFTNVLNQYPWMESCVCFNHCYTDSGLFGIMASCHPEYNNAIVDVIARQFDLVTSYGRGGVTQQELMRAKNQLKSSLFMNFTADKANNKIYVEREFAAPVDLVWESWTNPEIMDLWWAPRPWKTTTKSMNFVPGGTWLYYMSGPTGERHYCRADYEKINPQVMFSGLDGFCDENGVINEAMPRTHWDVAFNGQTENTRVNVTLAFKSLEDLEGIINMGFKEGFLSAMDNLDEFISAQFQLRKDKKQNNEARVSTYVNFPGNAEEAVEFYKSVFKTEFINGLQRFGDIPESTENPIAENVKKMVLHCELPLLGNHVLMATDAPKEMGFELKQGNNMHINLEPDSREEADRIFSGLSAGGNISMPLQDMFWGAYFGSFTDKYGINWMVNYQPK